MGERLSMHSDCSWALHSGLARWLALKGEHHPRGKSAKHIKRGREDEFVSHVETL